MAIGGKKDLVANENLAMKTEIRLLRELLQEKRDEIKELRESLRAYREALIAKESPDAYHEQRLAQEKRDMEQRLEESESDPEYQRRRQLAKLNGQLLMETESPLFKSVDDMIDQLGRVQGEPELRSLHGDDES